MPYDAVEAPPPPLELLDIELDHVREAATPPAGAVRRPSMRAVAITLVVGALAVGAIWRSGLVDGPGSTTPPLDPAAPAGIGDFAELFVATYLTATGEDGSTELRRYYAAAPVAPDSATADRYVMRTAALTVRQLAPSYWEVGVAADVLIHDGVGYQRDGIHHYLVGVVESAAGYAATSLPSRVAAPGAASIPAVASGVPIEDPAMHTLVDGFLNAYLTGAGDLGGYVSADAELESPVGAAFTAVSVRDVSGLAARDGSAWLRVTGIAIGPTGSQLPIEYHLVVVTEGGTLGVESVAAGPPTPAQAHAATSTPEGRAGQ